MKVIQNALTSFILLLMLLTTSSINSVYAHSASDSYLYLTTKENQLQWDIALRDLDGLIALDENNNGEITWHEVNNNQANVFSLALSNLTLKAGQDTCTTAPTGLTITQHLEVNYASVTASIRCNYQAPTQAEYSLLFSANPLHRAMLRVTTDTAEFTHTFTPTSALFSWTAPTPLLTTVTEYLQEGIWHIWTGYDHLIFLFALLLPSVLQRRNHQWLGIERLRPVLQDIVKVVTAFTLAHSITLSLAATGVASLPSRWVETVIALSVSLAALNILLPIFNRSRWVLAFVLGLIHGFGFAGALSELGLPSSATAAALISFNLGVESGQLTVVAVLIPVLFAIRNAALYTRTLLPAGAMIIFLIGLFWAAERCIEPGISTPDYESVSVIKMSAYQAQFSPKASSCS